MSFTYLPGQAVYLPAGSLVLDQSATWKKIPTAPRLSRPVSVTAFLTMRLSGQIFVALPGETTRSGASSGRSESLDAALWLRQVSRANPSRPPEKCGPDWTKETAGRTPFVSLERSDPDGCYWKMCQACLPGLTGIMDRYSESWPRAGILLGGTVYQLPPLAPLTKGTGSGLWPTPTAHKPEAEILTETRGSRLLRPDGRTYGMNLATAGQRWPTPQSTDGTKAPKYHKGGNPSLPQAVKLWPTPTGADGSGGPGHSGREGGLNLRTAVSLWPTSTVNGNNNRKGLSATSGDGLATAVKSWATPCASPWRTPNQNGNHADQLPNQVGGSLNPDWVEWLMNWPIGWTDLEPLRKDYFDDWKQRSQTGTTDVSSGMLRIMWWDRDPSETPYRPRSNEQRPGQCSDPLSELPHGGSPERGNMGQGTGKESDMPYLRGDISTETEPPQYPLREEELLERVGETEGDGTLVPRVATGIKNRQARLRAIGNGQVPIVVAIAWELLSK